MKPPSTPPSMLAWPIWLRRWVRSWESPGLMAYLTLALIALIALGMWLGQRRSERAGMEQMAAVAAERLELYAASLEAELARHAYLPSLIAIDADIQALLKAPVKAPNNAGLRQRADRKLAGINVRAGLALSFVLGPEGQVLSASDGLGDASAAVAVAQRFAEQLTAGAEQTSGHFFAGQPANGSSDYFLLHTVKRGGRRLGQVVLMQSLAPLEATWVDQGLRSQGEKLLVVDDKEVVIMSSVPEWRNHLLNQRTPAQKQQLQASARYAGPLLAGLGDFDHEALQQAAALVRVDGQDLLAQERALLPLALRLVTLSDPAEVWRNARYAGWGGASIAATIGMLALYLVSRRRAHAELERQVGERTQELSQTNHELKRQIAQRLQAEDELMQSAKLAVLGQMSAGIAHEVNQPLTAMRALSRNSLLLLEKGRNAAVAENLSSIDAMVERMTGITRQLKSFARKAEAAHAPVSLAHAISGARLLLEHRLQAEQVELDLEVDAELLVRCEPNRLEQVLINLLANALDAMKDAPHKRLSIRAVAPDTTASKRVLVQVCDSGAGIAAELLPRLFEPFFTTKPAGQGLGLGLVISAKIIHEFGGTLRAHARSVEAGGGMMFEFDLEVCTRDKAHV